MKSLISYLSAAIIVLLSTGCPLWSQNAAVGALAGEFNVSGSGGATYSIPIECPAGLNGMTPSLSLTYNSQAGDGSLGMCWSLSGLSAITRIPKTLFSTSAVKGVDYSIDDHYALDGNPLVLISGDYGRDASVYYTESETYQQITAYGSLQEVLSAVGPEKFVVATKDGREITYGATANSRFVPKGAGYQAPYMWLISRITDKNGNYIDYKYDPSSSTVRLSEIVYGNTNGSFISKIRFLPLTRYVGGMVSYVGGRPVINDFVYSNVGIENNGKMLYDYQLDYTINEGKFFLTTVTKRIPASAHLVPPTCIEWGGNTTVPTVESVGAGLYYSVPRENCQFIPCDINGDGKDDLISVYNYNNTNYLERLLNTGTSQRKTFSRTKPAVNIGVSFNFDDYTKFSNAASLLADVNGDGINEFISTYLMKISGYNPTFKIDIFTADQMYEATLSLSHSNDAPVFVCGDFNNDGYDDLLFIEDRQVDNVYTGQLIYFRENYQIFSQTLSFDLPDAPGQVYCADFNGNGLTDLFILTRNDCYFYKNNGGSENANRETQISFSRLPDYAGIHFSTDCKAIRMGDFNGDGLPDFLVNRERNKKNVWDLAMNNGKYALVAPVSAFPEVPVAINDNKKECLVADYDHDGKSEVILIDRLGDGRTKIDWYKSSALGFANVRSQTVSRQDYFFRGSACVGNFSGSGRQELFAYECCLWEEKPASESWIVSCPNTGFKEEKVTSITDGLGKRIDLTYQSLSLADAPDGRKFYTCDKKRKSFAYANIQVPLICAEGVKVSDASQTFSETLYSYADLVYGVRKKSLYGFTGMTVEDKLAGVRTVKTSTWDYETGFPIKTVEQIRTADGSMMNDIMSENTLVHNRTYRLLPVLQRNINYLDSYTTGLYYEGYDEWGNPAVVISRCIDAEEKELREYTSVGSWCNNRISKSTLQRTGGGGTYQRVREYAYDDRGNLVREVQDPGDANSLVTEYGDFDVFSQPRQTKVSGSGVTRTSSVTYTSSGRYPASVTDELGETVTYRWDESNGCKQSETSPRGTTHYSYDVWGRLTGETSPEGISTTYELSLSGGNAPGGSVYSTVIRTAGQSPVTTWYDVLGRELRSEVYGLNGRPIRTDTEYDRAGRISRKSEPYFSGDAPEYAESYTYDKFGRVSTLSTPLGKTQYTYGKLSTTVVSPSQTQTTVTDTEGKVIEQITNGKSVTYAYYPSGLLKEATPQGGKPVRMKYDLQGNRTLISDPDGGNIYSAYNAFGQLTKETQRVHKIMAEKDTINTSIGGGTYPGGGMDVFSGRTSTNGFPDVILDTPPSPFEMGVVVTSYSYLPSGLLDKVKCGGKETRYTYDSRHRLIRIWEVESASSNVLSSIYYRYDEFDRLIHEDRMLGTDYLFCFSKEYDEYGRLLVERYPSGDGVQRVYDDYGNVYFLGLLANHVGTEVWQLLETNAKGQILREKKSQNLVTTYTYNRLGQVTSIVTPSIYQEYYTYNDKGLLTARKDVVGGQSESFTYDEHNRLTQWTVSSQRMSFPARINSVTYDSSMGNIVQKSDVGYTFSYKKGEHSLTSISGKPSAIPLAEQKITYTDFKKVKTIVQGDKSLEITYGVDKERWKETLTTPEGTRTVYFGDNYEDVIEKGVSRKMIYIRLGSRLVGIAVKKTNLTPSTRIIGGDSIPYRPSEPSYYSAFTDRQGSLLALCSETKVERRYSYDPWGQRRDPYYWVRKDMLSDLIIHRGYTLHEHLDEFGLINMNGRVYDPLLGMFLSPDPYIQAPDNWLNYNRYSYCLNNPLMYTDPSGEIFGIDDLIFGALFAGMANVVSQIGSGHVNSLGSMFQAFGIGALGGIAGTAAGGLLNGAGFISGAINGFAGGFAGGFLTGAINSWANGDGFGQGLKSGLISGGIAGGTGALLGGLMSGSTAMENGGNYWTGKGTTYEDIAFSAPESKQVKIGEGMTYSNEYAQNFSNKYFSKGSKWVENLYADGRVPFPYIKDGDLVRSGNGYIRGLTKQRNAFGKCDIYLFKQAFTSREQLYLTMGHEYLHAGFNFLNLKDYGQQHASIRDWQYKQAKIWNYKVQEYKSLNNINSYISSKYRNSNVYFDILKKRPW